MKESCEIYENPKEMSKLLSKYFQKMFIREIEFRQLWEEREDTCEIMVNKRDTRTDEGF